MEINKSMENERVCVKCNKVLHNNEGYCSNCGMLSAKPVKGTIIIKVNSALPLGFCLILIGICIIIIMSILLINGVSFDSRVLGYLYGLGIVFIVIACTLIKKQREFIHSRKRELKNDRNLIYCQYCNTVLDETSNYCYFCGAKNKVSSENWK